MPPRTRNWKAMETPDFAGRRYHLDVKGEVEVTATNKTPHLSVHTPQGFNPRILLLDLTIRTEGDIGGAVMMWKPVRYQQGTNGNQYDEVNILFEGDIIQRIKVEHPKAAAPAKKKAAAKKKTVKKAAKKAAKKTKTAKKKTRKKAAKKARKKKRL